MKNDTEQHAEECPKYEHSSHERFVLPEAAFSSRFEIPQSGIMEVSVSQGPENGSVKCMERKNMGVSLIFKIAAVGILVTILNQVLKHSGREEHAFMVSLAGLILVLTWIVPYIYDLFRTIQALFAL